MNVVYAKTSSVVSLPGGGQIAVRIGTHWAADDPVVLAQPSLFSRDPYTGLNYSTTEPPAREERAVETATAAPGERRPNPGNMRRGA